MSALAAVLCAAAAVGGEHAVGAEKLKIVSVTDSPDPFSPAIGELSIQASFEARPTDAGAGSEKNEKSFAVRVTVEIDDEAWELVREISGEFLFDFPDDLPASKYCSVVVSMSWDGKDDEGKIVPDGRYTYTVRGELLRRDVLGNGRVQERTVSESGMLSGVVLLDASSPVITEISPAAGAWVRDALVPITAAYSDAPSGIHVPSVRLVVAGEDVTRMARVNHEGVGYFPFEPFGEGAVDVSLSLRDRAGNEARSDWSFSVDTKAPVISELMFGRTPSNDPFEAASAAFSDAGGGVDVEAVLILLDDEDVTDAADVGSDGFHVVPPEALAEGLHVLRVYISDLAGNAAGAECSVEIDLTPPPAPVVEQVDRTETHVTLRGPSPPDVFVIDAWADAAELESAVIESFSVVFRKTEYDSFAYSLRFVDEAGNVGEETWGEESFLPEVVPLEVTLEFFPGEQTGSWEGFLLTNRRPFVLYGELTGSPPFTASVKAVDERGVERVFSAEVVAALFTSSLDLPDGKYTVTATVTDSTGATGTSDPAEMISDTVPPTFEIIEPLYTKTVGCNLLYLNASGVNLPAFEEWPVSLGERNVFDKNSLYIMGMAIDARTPVEDARLETWAGGWLKGTVEPEFPTESWPVDGGFGATFDFGNPAWAVEPMELHNLVVVARDAAGNRGECAIPVKYDSTPPGVGGWHQLWVPGHCVTASWDAVSVMTGAEELVKWAPWSDKWYSETGFSPEPYSPLGVEFRVEDLAGNVNYHEAIFEVADNIVIPMNSMVCFPIGAKIFFDGREETVERVAQWPGIGGYTLGDISTGTGGICQLRRSDEEKRFIYSPETLVEAPGYFPQLDEEKRPKGIEYFATRVIIWAGPASVEFAWGVLPEGMEQPPDEEPPDWASASGTAVRVQPPEMSIYWWRFPGLWDGGVHVEAEIHDGWSPPLGGTFRAENRGQAIALRVDPDIVPTGKVTVFIDGWYGEEEAGNSADVVFQKREAGVVTAEVRPTRTRVIYRDFTKRHVYQSILCEVDFTEPEGADYVGLWDVLVNCGQVQSEGGPWRMKEALRLYRVKIELLTPITLIPGGQEELAPVSGISLSYPRPAVMVDLLSPGDVSFGSDGSITVSVSGEVFDPLAEILPDGIGNIADVKLVCDDLEETVGLAAAGGGTFSFSGSVTIADPGTSVPIQVTTSKNAIGMEGEASLHIGIAESAVSGRDYQDSEGNPPIVLTEGDETLNVVLPEGFPDEENPDTIAVYAGDREAQAEDPEYLETEETLVFEGPIIGLFQVFRLKILDFTSLNEDVRDTFSIEVTGDQGRFVTFLRFTETGTNSRRFMTRFAVLLTPNTEFEAVTRTVGGIDIFHDEDREVATSPYVPILVGVKGDEQILSTLHGELDGVEFGLEKVRPGDDRFFFTIDNEAAIFCFVPVGSKQVEAPNLVEVSPGQSITARVCASPGGGLEVKVDTQDPRAVPFQDNASDSAEMTLTLRGKEFPSKLQVVSRSAPPLSPKIEVPSVAVDAQRTTVTVKFVLKAGTKGGNHSIVLRDPVSGKLVRATLHVVRVEPHKDNPQAVLRRGRVRLAAVGSPRGGTYDFTHQRTAGPDGTFAKITKNGSAQWFTAPDQKTANRGNDKLVVQYTYTPPGGPAVTVSTEQRLDTVEPDKITIVNGAQVGMTFASPNMKPWSAVSGVPWIVYAKRAVQYRLRDHFDDPVHPANHTFGGNKGIRVHIYETYTPYPLYSWTGIILPATGRGSSGFRVGAGGVFVDLHAQAGDAGKEGWRKTPVGGSVVFSDPAWQNRVDEPDQELTVELIDRSNNASFFTKVLATGIKLRRLKGIGVADCGVGVKVPDSIERE